MVMRSIHLGGILLIFSLSCSRDSDSEKHTVGIDVQSSFEDDRVEILIDGKQIFDKTLTTNHLLGVCNDGRFTTILTEALHQIKVTVNNSITKTEFFEPVGQKYLGINFDQQEVTIIFSETPFGYD
jgi:hypothetical protein